MSAFVCTLFIVFIEKIDFSFSLSLTHSNIKIERVNINKQKRISLLIQTFQTNIIK